MEIPLQAQVECTDGICGHCVYVLIDPVLDRVTHLVVKEQSSPHTEHVVPVGMVSATTPDIIRLRCDKARLETMDPFIQTEYVEAEIPEPHSSYADPFGTGSVYYWPYVTSESTVKVPVEHPQVPPGELAVRRGTRVEATDGFAGKVDEFLVNPENGNITYLVMREGHLWGQKEVVIPVSAIRDACEDTVLLTLDRHEIESLPAVPVHRHWS